ncbi:MAG TPA: NB-ARC domain-containing protein [Caldilineaceae bacterium]|nr:NB-ARC domain-containing protein [Caldilineaceae bacterium]
MTTNLTPPHPTHSSDWLTHNNVHQALLGWHNGGLADTDISTLYLFRRGQLQAEEAGRLSHNTILCHAVEQLRQLNAEYAEILQLRFMDNIKADRVANRLNLATSTFYDRQKAAIEQLTEILRSMDESARKERYATLESKLAYRHKNSFVGIDALISMVGGQLNQSSSTRIVSIEGIGGIGKTTLAGEAVRHALWHDITWENTVWITAHHVDFSPTTGGDAHGGTLTADDLLEELYRQLIAGEPIAGTASSTQRLAALEVHLRQHKTLVVIDNLETISDIESLLPILRRLMNPSKFVLTSRQSFYAESEVYHVPMSELSEADAINLVRAEARGNNLMQVVAASDEELRPIYTTAGGNPLALRLVVGQLHIFDLGQVLADLTEARSRSAESLYTFIFRRAWEHMSEPTRLLFIAMLLTSDDGDTFDELLAICQGDVSDIDLRTGLRQLVMFNLVESRGNLFERRYAIHNLTRSFLHRQVKIWQEVV